MNRRQLLASGLTALAAMALAGCGRDRYRWRQKLTVNVRTPSGMKSGSAVTEVTVHVSDGGLNGHAMSQSFRGEASVVDLDGGRHLFALLANTGGASNTVYQAEFTFADRLPSPGANLYAGDRARLGAIYGIIQALREQRPMPRDSYPMLVTFADINDPASVKLVDPKNLAASFGPGYALHSITLEITDEKVTKGEVEKVLGWINDFHDKSLDGNDIITLQAKNRLANDLGAGNFTTERQ